MRSNVLIACLFLAFSMEAQYSIIGFVYDTREDPFIGSRVTLKGGEMKQETFTDKDGMFVFRGLPRNSYTVLVITEYGLLEKKIDLKGSVEMNLQKSRAIKVDEVVVRAVRAPEDAPVTNSILLKEEIQDLNLGQDVPYLLKWTPSTVVTSDGGTGIGYTGLRIRGTDATRINVTINGVPLNDAESQGVFWVDLPDVLGSAESMQVQRGVGSSSFGAGAFGSSINISTVGTNTKPYLKLNGTIGSFGTFRASTNFGTGILKNHFTVDGRLSYTRSDGYIDRASAELRSFFLSGAFIGRHSTVRLNILSGEEVTYQAWNGVPVQYQDDPNLRTFNTSGMEREGAPYRNEVDDYKQTHYQLMYQLQLAPQLHSFATLHYTKGKGFFEQYKAFSNFGSAMLAVLEPLGADMTDLIRRRWLDNDFYGGIAGIEFVDPDEKYNLQLGSAFHHYKGRHFGEIFRTASGVDPATIPHYYDNDAVKKDGSFFGKINYAIGEKTRAYIDLQLRYIEYEFFGFDARGEQAQQNVEHNFFNPKIGLTYAVNPNNQIYLSFGVANREPNRNDYVDSSPSSRPKSERLLNTELGFRNAGKVHTLGINFYHMSYQDQLALSGRINDVGAATRINVEDSYRLGLEINGEVMFSEKISGNISATLSQNKIKAFDEFIDNWDFVDGDAPGDIQLKVGHRKTDLSFSPNVLVSAGVQYTLLNKKNEKLLLDMMGKYVGKQFIDNTSNDLSALDAYFFSDAKLTIKLGKKGKRPGASISLLARNVFDKKYSSNAWTYRFKSEGYNPVPDDPYAAMEGNGFYHLTGVFPQAGRNFLAAFTLEL